MTNTSEFETNLIERLDAQEFVYETSDALKRSHIFGTAFDPVWYPQGVIFRKQDQSLAEKIAQEEGRSCCYPTLTLCFPNESCSVKPDDGNLYSNKRLLEFLLTNDIKRLCIREPTSLRYGIMASANSASIDEGSLQFSLSPKDARKFSNDLAELAYIVMRAEYDFFEKNYSAPRRKISALGWGHCITPFYEEFLGEVVNESVSDGVNLRGWKHGLFKKMITVYGTHRVPSPRSDPRVCKDARVLLKTRFGNYVIESPEGNYFTEDPRNRHPHQFSATTYATSDLAEEARKRLIGTNYSNPQEWKIREVNRELINEFKCAKK